MECQETYFRSIPWTSDNDHSDATEITYKYGSSKLNIFYSAAQKEQNKSKNKTYKKQHVCGKKKFGKIKVTMQCTGKA